MATAAVDTEAGHTITIQVTDHIKLVVAAVVSRMRLHPVPAFTDGTCVYRVEPPQFDSLWLSDREIENDKYFHSFFFPLWLSFRLGPEQSQNPDLQTQPAMLTLKQFLATQDDSISDSDAIEKYNEYKLEFKRQQLNEFFVAHKDEEW